MLGISTTSGFSSGGMPSPKSSDIFNSLSSPLAGAPPAPSPPRHVGSSGGRRKRWPGGHGPALLCCAVPGRWEEGGLFPQSFSLTSLQSGCLLCPGLEAMPAALPRRRQSHPSHHYQPLTAPLVSGGRKGLKYAAVGLHCWELAFQVTPCTLAAYLGNAAESSWEVRTQTSSKAYPLAVPGFVAASFLSPDFLCWKKKKKLLLVQEA